MASNIIDRHFYNTCVPIPYPCTTGDSYIDPCSCIYYFQCANRDSILHRPCADGNGFDHKKNTCRLLTDIVYQDVCDQKEPWGRCSKEHANADEDALQQRCTKMAPGPKGEEGVDGGLIAGIIIAVLVVVIIAVLVIIYVRKKGNPLRNLRSAKSGRGQDTSQSAPRHGSGPEEETYAEIEDTAMYKDPSGGRHLVHSLSHTNENYDKDEVVAYDNPALKRDTPPPPDLPEAPPDYSALEMEHMPRSYASLNEHKAATTKNDRNFKEPMTGDDGYLMAEAIGESRLSTSLSDPNYFVLEKSDT